MCGSDKSPDNFNRNKRTTDGLSNYCKDCTRIKNREQYVKNAERRKREARQYRAANAEAVRERDRERWQKRKLRQAEYKRTHRDKINETQRAWRAANPNYFRDWEKRPERREYAKAWRKANRELRRDQERERRRTNPEPFRRSKHAYRARKLSVAHVPYSDDQLRQKLTYWSGRCWMCGKTLTTGFHWDHVKPLNRGGSDMLSNLRPACGPCNKAKRDTWPWPSVR